MSIQSHRSELRARSGSDTLTSMSGESLSPSRSALRSKRVELAPIKDTLISASSPINASLPPYSNTSKLDTIQTSSMSPYQKKSVLKPSKPPLVSFFGAFLMGLQGASFVIASAANDSQSFLQKFSTPLSIGYFFFKIGDFFQAAVKLFKKPTWLRAYNFFNQGASITSIALTAVVSAAKFGLIAIRLTSTLIAQYVFGAINLLFSIFDSYKIHSLRKDRDQLKEMDLSSDRATLSEKLKALIASDKVLRSRLKELLSSPSEIEQFNQLLDKQPHLAHRFLMRCCNIGIGMNATSLVASIIGGVGGIVAFFVPPVGFIMAAVSGLIAAVQWITGFFLNRSLRKELLALNEPQREVAVDPKATVKA